MYDEIMDLSKDNCGKTVTCPVCDGGGQVLIVNPISGKEDYDTCPECGGAGEVIR